MQTIRWSAEMSLGVPAMDEAHQILLAELNRLGAAPDDEFAQAYLALIAAFERDFREEEALMAQINFPARRSHCEAHARALNGMLHVEQQVRDGDVEAGREVIKQLPHWILHHLSTMDLALAVALDMAKTSASPSSSPYLRAELARTLNDNFMD